MNEKEWNDLIPTVQKLTLAILDQNQGLPIEYNFVRGKITVKVFISVEVDDGVPS